MLRSPNLVDFIFYLKYMFQVSNSGFYTKNISAFLDVHLKPIAAKISSYIKDTNDFLRKLQSLPKLSDEVISMTRVCYSLKERQVIERIKLSLLNLLSNWQNSFLKITILNLMIGSENRKTVPHLIKQPTCFKSSNPSCIDNF